MKGTCEQIPFHFFLKFMMLSVAGGKTRVVKGQDAVLTVTNSYTRDKGSLELEKVFAGGKTAGDLTDAQKEAIHFTITGPDNYSKDVKYSEFTDGKYKLTDLPTGEYQVTESGADFDKNYSLTVSYSVTDGKAAVTKASRGNRNEYLQQRSWKPYSDKENLWCDPDG